MAVVIDDTAPAMYATSEKQPDRYVRKWHESAE
jgi:hypothetical protein